MGSNSSRYFLFFGPIILMGVYSLWANAQPEKPKKTPSTKSSLTPDQNLTPKLSKDLQRYCDKINRTFTKYNWKESYCHRYSWNHVRNSVLGTPLIWAVYGKEKKISYEPQDTTLVFCGVHGDEITPIKFCFDILDYLHQDFKNYKNKLIVVAPIINPDSFFKDHPSRTNQHGIDINRNFPTSNWHKYATSLWKSMFNKDARRNPGKQPLSEPEVVFQVNLIKRYRPDKIISVHAPLTMLDYDGPEVSKQYKKTHQHGLLAYQLLMQMSQSAHGYRIKNFRTYPGSLGHWAGEERKIPTYTLELPTSDAAQSDKYWKLLKTAIHHAFINDLKSSKKETEKVAKQ